MTEEDIERLPREQYPGDLPLHPSDDLHDELVDMICRRAEFGKRVIDAVESDMESMDWTLDGYMEADEHDAAMKAHDPRKPVTIVIPMSYAMLQIFITYMSNAFLKDNVIHKIRGVGDLASHARAALLERVLSRQAMWFNQARALDILWGDAFTYGRGLMYGKWSKQRGPAVIDEEVTELLSAMLKASGLGDFKPGEMLRTIEEQGQVLREGVKWQAIDQYQCFYDPNVTPDDIQDSEFIGWVERTSATALMSLADDPEEGQLFNLEAARYYARREQGHSRYWRDQGGRRKKNPTANLEMGEDRQIGTFIDVVHMFMNIVPSEWGLSDRETPEKWRFAVACDEILILAEPVNMDHGMYPVVACAPNARGHEVFPVSNLMTTYGMQQSVDWHARSRNLNVITSVNGMWLVDPSKVEVEDFKGGDGPKVIRLKNNAFGEGKMEQYIKQIQIQDVTAGHWGDIAGIQQIAKDGNGTQDILMGSPQGIPDRPTARGMDMLQGGALSRLNTYAMRIDQQTMVPMGWQSAFNTIQFMDQEVMVDISGRNEAQLMAGMPYMSPEEAAVMGRSISVSASALPPTFDLIPYSDVRPEADNMVGMDEVMKSVLASEAGQMVLLKSYDIAKILDMWLMKHGFSDVSEFRVQVAPDAAVQQGVQSGALASMSGAN